MFNRKKKQEDREVTGMMSNHADNVAADPFGMYTGIPDDPHERPIQDADDL